MTKKLSIGDKLKKSYNQTPDAQRTICLEWADEWYKEQLQLIKSLETIIQYRNYEQLEPVKRKLEKLTGDKFIGLKNVVNRLTDYELVE